MAGSLKSSQVVTAKIQKVLLQPTYFSETMLSCCLLWIRMRSWGRKKGF